MANCYTVTASDSNESGTAAATASDVVNNATTTSTGLIIGLTIACIIIMMFLVTLVIGAVVWKRYVYMYACVMTYMYFIQVILACVFHLFCVNSNISKSKVLSTSEEYHTYEIPNPVIDSG